MRISDWSSDVCSSDLAPECPVEGARPQPHAAAGDRLHVLHDRVAMPFAGQQRKQDVVQGRGEGNAAAGFHRGTYICRYTYIALRYSWQATPRTGRRPRRGPGDAPRPLVPERRITPHGP